MPLSVPIIRKLPSNLLRDCADLFELAWPLLREPHSALLDSGPVPAGPADLRQFSYMGWAPYQVLSAQGTQLRLWKRRESGGRGHTRLLQGDPFEQLQILLQETRTEQAADWIPFTSGAVGYLGYGLRERIEQVPRVKKDSPPQPDMVFCWYDRLLAWDHRTREAWLCVTPGQGSDPDAVFQELVSLLNICRPLPEVRRYFSRSQRPEPRMAREDYRTMITRCKELIAAGEIYQANLSHQFVFELPGRNLVELYAALRTAHPAPFGAFLNYPGFSVLSLSPERFLRVQGSRVETRPIKGTAARGATNDEDRVRASQLLQSTKDAAEHVMIVDLERNDLGRVCKPGSVRVERSAELESYATVHHLVSTIAGQLREGTGPVDCLRATFPGGSISGAPKVRAMQIIEELEPLGRGLYTGSIGWISGAGNMDFSIVIRTILAQGNKGYLHVGGGIVADSDPDAEYQETLHKAAAFLQVLGGEVSALGSGGVPSVCRGEQCEAIFVENRSPRRGVYPERMRRAPRDDDGA
ncbi:MAG: aminodeoxychorismate synthase component I [Candidatus Omnitrophica bacterium]|nr:aminodeoxychorismate synthase component I [Candidatus Omnitrophota bacterium]